MTLSTGVGTAPVHFSRDDEARLVARLPNSRPRSRSGHLLAPPECISASRKMPLRSSSRLRHKDTPPPPIKSSLRLGQHSLSVAERDASLNGSALCPLGRARTLRSKPAGAGCAAGSAGRSAPMRSCRSARVPGWAARAPIQLSWLKHVAAHTGHRAKITLTVVWKGTCGLRYEYRRNVICRNRFLIT